MERSRRHGRIGQFFKGKKAMYKRVARSLSKRPHLWRARPDLRTLRTSSSTAALIATMMMCLLAGRMATTSISCGCGGMRGRSEELASTVRFYGGANRSLFPVAARNPR